jgi:nitrogen regulatory protein PII
MSTKLIVAIVAPERTDKLMDVARGAGATGATIITGARGEGMFEKKGVLGLDLTKRRDVLLFLTPEALSQKIMQSITTADEFDESPGTGVVFMQDVEDVHGLRAALSATHAEPDES